MDNEREYGGSEYREKLTSIEMPAKVDSQPGTVDWELARRVAVKVAGHDPYSDKFYRRDIIADFTAYTEQAEGLVERCTGLVSNAGSARGKVIDRVGWIDANLSAFQRLLAPIMGKLSSRLEGKSVSLTRYVAGVEFGVVLGWMAKRVLGQYDLLIIEDEKPEEQDMVYYVAPNVLTLENHYAFNSKQFRLWLALHEVTHRAQFTGVSWMRSYFLGLVKSTLSSIEPDPKRVAKVVSRVLEARRRGEDPLASGGLMALFASEAQIETLNKLVGLMSLLEGHGDVIMSRAGEGLTPSAARFGHVIRSRRQSAKGWNKAFQKLIGLDAKIRQYAEGENFIEQVELSGGRELMDCVWESPENLPNIQEIRSPELWLERMGVNPAGMGALSTV